jgi:hypothetical protein
MISYFKSGMGLCVEIPTSSTSSARFKGFAAFEALRTGNEVPFGAILSK